MKDDLPTPPPEPDPPSPEQERDATVTARVVDDPETGGGLPEGEPPEKPLRWREQIDRSWPLTLLMVFGVMGLTVVIFLLTSGLSLLAAELLVLREIPRDPSGQMDAVAAVWQSRIGFILMILPPQLSLLIAPVSAAWLFPEGPRRGLRLVRGRWPVWIWIAAALATPFVGLMSTLIMGDHVEESESLKTLTDAFRAHGQTGFLLPIAILIGLAPAVCEELLFRGFLQPRLTRLLGPGVGVLFASLAFAAFHIDPVHVVLVFPLGLWLGFLCYRSGSIFPAILGHFVNNVVAVISVMSEDTGTMDIPDATITVPILAGGIVGLVAVGYASWRWKVE